MANDFYGKTKGVIYLGVLNGASFEKRYMELSASEDKIPLASTILRVQSSENMIEAWIFYETKPKDNRTFNKTDGKVETKPAINIEM